MNHLPLYVASIPSETLPYNPNDTESKYTGDRHTDEISPF